MVFEFRVTKYDPAHRNPSGKYMRDEWTSVSDIGRSFSGVVFTKAEYQRVEDAYVAVAVSFMRESGVASLAVAGLENNGSVPLSFGEGAALAFHDVEFVIRQVLQEKFWCRLESANGFIHIGYDYYMYVGVRQLCPDSECTARQNGLFVESCRSPYRQITETASRGRVSDNSILSE